MRRNACAVSVPSTVETTVVAKARDSERSSASRIGRGAMRVASVRPNRWRYQ